MTQKGRRNEGAERNEEWREEGAEKKGQRNGQRSRGKWSSNPPFSPHSPRVFPHYYSHASVPKAV